MRVVRHDRVKTISLFDKDPVEREDEAGWSN